MTAPTIVRVAESAVGIHGLDDEQRAVLGFLSKYSNPRTRANYEADLRTFHNWVRQVPLPHLLAVERLHIQLFVRYLERCGLKPSTINRRIGTLRGFYQTAAIDDLIAKDPTLGVVLPKIDHDAQYRTWLTTLEFAALVKESRKNPRNHAMVAALGLLGMRVGEMLSLDVTDIHREIGEVYVTFIGKGGKRAKIRLPFEVMHAFDTYLAGRTEGPLFLDREGDSRWRANDVRRALVTLARNAGIQHAITPHGLRRTLASMLQERGVELGAIQQTMRHKDPRTTLSCYAMAGQTLADVARQTAAAVIAGMAS